MGIIIVGIGQKYRYFRAVSIHMKCWSGNTAKMKILIKVVLAGRVPWARL